MTRPIRAHEVQPHLPHHIVLRGNNRRNLFGNRTDRELFLRFVRRATETTLCSIHHLSILTNHVHLVMTPSTSDGLSDCIKRFAGSYAMQRNRIAGGSGKLFEQRFFCKTIISDEQMAVTAAYVDLNTEMGGVPSRYRNFTTLDHHLGNSCDSRIPFDLWTPSDWYLGLGRCVEERIGAYAHCLLRYREHKYDLLSRENLTLADSPCQPKERHLQRPNRSSAR